MVRDLVETSVRLIKEEKISEVKEQAEENANKRIVRLLVPGKKKQAGVKNPFEMLFGGSQTANDDEADQQEEASLEEKENAWRISSHWESSKTITSP